MQPYLSHYLQISRGMWQSSFLGSMAAKALGLSSWYEVGMDLVHEHRASYIHSHGFAPASEGWRRARAVTRAPSVGLRYWAATAAFHQ